MKEIQIWDLDGTIIDSSHRQSFDADGYFDLEYWETNSTPTNINKDKLLPHSELYINAIKDPDVLTIIATARRMSIHDIAFVHEFLGKPDYIVSRGTNDKRLDHDLKSSELKTLLSKYKNIKKVKFWDDNLMNIKKVNNTLKKMGHDVITCHITEGDKL